MYNLLNNEWVIAIVGGLATSYAVILINNLRVSRRDRIEFRQQTQLANNEVLSALRTLIAEEELPTPEILRSVITSTAHRHGLNVRDLHTATTVSDQIVSEIMANPFLSSKQKVSYGKLVLRLKDGVDDRIQPIATGAQVARKSRRDITFIIAASTFGSVSLGLFSLVIGDERLAVSRDSLKKILLFLAAAILIPTVVLWALDCYRDIKEWRAVGLGLDGSQPEVDLRERSR